MLTAQGLIVALLVAGCCFYAAWTLMPSSLRRSLAGALSKLPLPAPLARRFGRAAQAASGCGCDGCDRADIKTPARAASGGSQPITFHPRPRR